MSEISVEENVIVADIDGRKLKVNDFRPTNASGPVPGLLSKPRDGKAPGVRSGGL